MNSIGLDRESMNWGLDDNNTGVLGDDLNHGDSLLNNLGDLIDWNCLLAAVDGDLETRLGREEATGSLWNDFDFSSLSNDLDNLWRRRKSELNKNIQYFTDY